MIDQYRSYIHKITNLLPQFKSIIRNSRSRKNDLGNIIQAYHDEVFEEIDCLKCGNCCKQLGPRLFSSDLTRMSKSLGLRINEIEKRYTRIDEDKDCVFRSMPCPFLQDDITCLIYENRPSDCRDYPHTDKKMTDELMKITIKNAAYCPAVALIFLKIMEHMTTVKKR